MSEKLAVLFPGQGSQAVGMLADLIESSDVVKSTFTEAAEALGYDLTSLVLNGHSEQLNETHRTQPALLTASVAIYRHWLSLGGQKPNVLAGHSLGEYSALVCAGVISLTDAVKLVEKRGQYMQEAVPAGTGSMAAVIGLADEDVIKACADSAQDEVVSAVNLNSPGQVVIAGNKAAVERASEACKEAGAKRVLPLAVSVPSHCALMEPAAKKLAQDLETIEFNQPEISVINNVDVSAQMDIAQIKDALVRQLYCPVRWTETVQKLAQDGVTKSFEFGPGKVLSGLVKRIDKTISCVSVNDIASFEKVI